MTTVDWAKVLTVTKFLKNEQGEWYWHTQGRNNKIVGDSGESYRELHDAVHGFFVQQGIDPAVPVPAEQAHYSELMTDTENVEYHVYRYVDRAPNPIQVIAGSHQNHLTKRVKE